MVDGVHFKNDGIEIEQKIVLFFDIITDAAGRMGDCVHNRFAEGLRGTHSIQNNLKLSPIDNPLHTKYNISLRVNVEILFKYKTIKWIHS